MTTSVAGDGLRRWTFDIDLRTEIVWTAVLGNIHDFEVWGFSEVREDDKIVFKQAGDPEPLGKSALRTAVLLSLADLHRLAAHFAYVDMDVPQDRGNLLAILSNHFAPGDLEFKNLVLKGDVSRVDGIDLLARDEIFETTFAELDDEDKRELPNVKKALHHHRLRANSSHKSRLQAEAKAKATAKAKAAPKAAGPAPAPPPPLPAPVPVPPPPPAPIVPAKAAAPKPKAKAQAKALPGVPILHGDYRYISFCGGHIVFSSALRKINAHCLDAVHVTDPLMRSQKCHFDRTVPEHPNLFEFRVKGRPLGLLALWLKLSDASAERSDHAAAKADYAQEGFYDERRLAREELWATRLHDPIVLNLFALEARVPDELRGAVQEELWEPRRVF